MIRSEWSAPCTTLAEPSLLIGAAAVSLCTVTTFTKSVLLLRGSCKTKGNEKMNEAKRKSVIQDLTINSIPSGLARSRETGG